MLCCHDNGLCQRSKTWKIRVIMLATLLVKFRNKDCKTTELGLLLQVLPVRIVTLEKLKGATLRKVKQHILGNKSDLMQTHGINQFDDHVEQNLWNFNVSQTLFCSKWRMVSMGSLGQLQPDVWQWNTNTHAHLCKSSAKQWRCCLSRF